MKKIIIFLSIFMVCISVFAQSFQYDFNEQLKQAGLNSEMYAFIEFRNFMKINNSPSLKSASTKVDLLCGHVFYESGLAICKVEYEYDSLESLVFEYQYLWDFEQSAWLNDSKVVHENDERGNRTSMNTYVWLDSLSEWELRSSVEYLYDNDGNNNYTAIDLWYEATDAVTPSFSFVYEYYYNENSLDTLWTAKWYKQGAEISTSVQKTKYKYDSLGNLIQTLSYKNDKLKEKEIYNYGSSDGMVILKQKYIWDDEVLAWEEKVLERFIYDENENLISNQTLSVNASTGDTSELSLIEYEYDLLYTKVWQPYTHINHQNRLKLIIHSESLVAYADSFYYSVAEIANIKNDENGDVHVEVEKNSFIELFIYPNPVNNELHISTRSDLKGTYSILNYMGATIIDEKEIAETINISDLSSGVYFIQINYETKTETVRFVKD